MTAVKLTERYAAEDLDCTCQGWRIGSGRDLRLQREVIIAVAPLSMMTTLQGDVWLVKRASVSHVQVAELLDCAKTDKDFICVFEGGTEDCFGLPNLEMPALLDACSSIVDGVEVLANRRIDFEFSATQVVWDKRGPRVLGLFTEPETPKTDKDSAQVERLGAFIESTLEWNLLANDEGKVQQMSRVWRVGLSQLAGTDASNRCASFTDIRTVLQAMAMDHELARQGPRPRVVSHGRSPEPEPSIQAPLAAHLAIDGDIDTNTRPRRLWPALLVVTGLAAVIFIVGVYVANRIGANIAEGPISQTNPSHAASTSRSAPSVLGLTPQAAIDRLRHFGISTNAIQVIAVQSAGQTGLVVGVSSDLAIVSSYNEPVVLKVSVPRGSVLVPQLIGIPLAQATAILGQGKFHYSYILASSPGSAAGLVFKQQPNAFSVVPAWDKVTFEVAVHY